MTAADVASVAVIIIIVSCSVYSQRSTTSLGRGLVEQQVVQELDVSAGCCC